MPDWSDSEYWFVESAVDRGIPVHWLLGEDLDMELNRKGHNLQRGDVIATLDSLVQSGDLTFFKEKDQKIGRDESYSPSIPEIEEALDANIAPGDSCVYYALTAGGAAYWEDLAKPDWSKYLSVMGDSTGKRGTVLAGSRAKLERFLEVAMYWPSNSAMKPGTAKIDEVSPWEVTYWKTLERGYRARYETVQLELGPPHRSPDWVGEYLMVEMDDWCKGRFGPV